MTGNEAVADAKSDEEKDAESEHIAEENGSVDGEGNKTIMFPFF